MLRPSHAQGLKTRSEAEGERARQEGARRDRDHSRARICGSRALALSADALTKHLAVVLEIIVACPRVPDLVVTAISVRSIGQGGVIVRIRLTELF